MKPVEPIFVSDLFPPLHAELLALLRGLSDDDWHKPTLCALWNVKDIAVHLLDGDLRKLSVYRDHFFGTPPNNISSSRDLVTYLNQLNAEWVQAAKRISPRVLIELLEQTGRDISEFMRSLDPFAPSIFSVAWAGEKTSLNWFDTAREYTERWHHQQQIRLAVGAADVIMRRELYFPVLDTFMRALPFTYRMVQADEGTLLQVDITGEAGGVWFLLCTNNTPPAWQLFFHGEGQPTATVSIPQDIAWRLFTKGIEPARAETMMRFTGNEALGKHVLTVLAVMA